ncbi:MAG TPA: ATP-dependent DNA helicase RecG [Mesotoga sp.]|jgi:ATP-dependent DNA helicase RecG|uniref:ATP-dependent DNA helicase RecG n=1 Tax=unclassified Mesotoga TaxID=1184398 RepID=UPI000B07CBF2|nr:MULTISPECIES: ATP-dependent DNA helicase RecG [unclassified Mesotoga]HNU22991.1 ATP-dependent DNA helicase RecG [Mesotoga sp.]
MLFEQVLDECEMLFEASLSGRDNEVLFSELKRIVSQTDKEEFSRFPLLNEYLSKFVSYFSKSEALSQDRRKKRLINGLEMVAKLRRIFLLRTVDEIEALLGRPASLSTPIKYAYSVGEARSKILKRMDIETIGDLIYYFPRDYEDRRVILPISSLSADSKVSVRARILNFSVKKVSGYTIISAVAGDGFGQLLLKWFNQDYILQKLKKDKEYLIHGLAKKTPFGPLEMNSPEIEEVNGEVSGEILPVYSLTSGISMKMMRKITKRNLGVVRSLENLIPLKIKERRQLLERKHSFTAIHFPKSMFEARKARETLAYEEFFLFEIAVLSRRRQMRCKYQGLPKEIAGILAERLVESLPFELTEDQVKAFREIRDDMRATSPMSRLLQGDVGSGKTLVAELAITDNYEAGYQSALMVPTSVLAMQHFEKMKKDLEPLGIDVALLTGSLKKTDQESIRTRLTKGEIDVVVGTHSLIQEGVEFRSLGLVVVDEQHRFGVKQRETLTSKGRLLDSLVMTATPIPRTLALTVYGDLDVSTIHTMPKGRSPVRTILLARSRIDHLYSFISEEIKMGHQIFFIYPLVEESEQVDLKNATDEAARLREKVFPGTGVELLHGRLTDTEKQEIMQRFKSKKSMILVSTTVVEVGIDIPSATVMVIEHPERFGMAQLHQLRGRVGRSNLKSICVMLMNRAISGEALSRLREFASTASGFDVAELDLRLRGPGEFVGLRQHGMPQFLLGDIVDDRDLLFKAREDAQETIERDPDLLEHGALRIEMQRLYSERVRLIEVG